MCRAFEVPEQAHVAEEDAELALLLEAMWHEPCSEQLAVPHDICSEPIAVSRQ